MLHLTGYDVTLDDLKLFRQLHSKTPGHPENMVTPGVEVSTGPLGQGLSNAVGMALAERHLAAVYNKPDGFESLIDHYTYVICGDGCLQEGITSEACSLAGHWGLGKLIVCYDDNEITIDGNTNLSFTENVSMRYESYGWHVQTVLDVNNLSSLSKAIEAAKAEQGRPSLIKIHTIIGFGSSKEGTGGVHGAPLGASDLSAVKKKFGFDPLQSFNIPSSVSEFYHSCGQRGAANCAQWDHLFSSYQAKYPKEGSELVRRIAGILPDGWIDNLPENPASGGKVAATRNYSGAVLNAVANHCPELVGGSADLSGSNCTFLDISPKSFQKDTPDSRYIHFGVREHAMTAICNGMFAHGAIRPFCATFLNFIGYALGAVRVSALSEMGIIFIMTHDSIGLGEDGPTHQPIEMLDTLRCMPNLLLIRPADLSETKGAYVVAMQHAHTPTVISLSRQNTAFIQGSSYEKVALGGYVIKDWKRPEVLEASVPTLVIASTGTELTLAVQTAQLLSDGGSHWIRVVSLPCTQLFDRQSLEYRLSVFPEGSPVMSIEASGTFGWSRYAHAPFGIKDNTFGLSAPGGTLYEHFGFTVPNLVVKAREVIEFYDGKVVHSLMNKPCLV